MKEEANLGQHNGNLDEKKEKRKLKELTKRKLKGSKNMFELKITMKLYFIA